MESYLVLITTFVIALAARYADYATSGGKYSGVMEKNALFRTDGQFDAKKFWIAFGIFSIVVFVISIWLKGWAGSAFLVFALISFIRAILNKEKAKKGREAQVAFLRNLRGVDSDDDATIDSRFSTLPHFYQGKSFFYPLFKWIRETDEDTTVAMWRVRRRILAYSKQAETSWFK